MFKFNLEEEVVITLNNKVGTIRGRAEYSTGNANQYSIHYTNGVGDAVYDWFYENDIQAVSPALN